MTSTRYTLLVSRSSDGWLKSFTLKPTEPGYEALYIAFAPAMPDAARLLALRLARIVAGLPSSLAWATQWD
jgi:hypothetical protein